MNNKNNICYGEHGHEHDHNHEHKYEHNHEHGSAKHEIIRLSAAAIMLILAIALKKIFDLTGIYNVLLFGIAYIIAGSNVLKEAAENIMGGNVFDENFLMCVASIGAFLVGEYPEAVFVMIFYGVGELFEHIATNKSRHTVNSLLDTRPDTAVVIKNGVEENILSEDVVIGDTVKVLPGMRIPLDGIVISGDTTTDNSSITGETLPQAATVGCEVYSGCVNLSGIIEIRVSKSFSESTASKILALVESSYEKKAKSERFIKKFARIYTPVVCFAALILAVVPSLIFGNAKTYIYRALTFLVVSCPCALVVSIPLTYFAGIASAAKKGILIKGAQYLEALTRVKTVLFDKTGTLTKGDFEVIAVHPETVSERELLRIAAAAESGSIHPISLSLRAAYGKMEKVTVENVKEISGEGIHAVIAGKETLVGNSKLMERFAVKYHDCHKAGTVIHVSQNGEYLGHIVIGDSVKEDTKSAIVALKSHGIKTVMLTGDRKAAANMIFENIGLDEYYAELKPEQKVEITEKYLNSKTVTAFVGDGINDAPVLSRADIGLAMGSLGSDAAIEAADIVLMDDKVSSVETAINVSAKTQKIVIENIVLSLAIKFLILFLCALGFGITNMWMASFGDVGVLVLAVLNSFRAIK